MIIRPFGISVHLQTNPISTPHARVTEWRDVITKRATLLTTQTWSRSRPLSWADAIGRFWWQVVAIYRGRIEIDHSYGLRCRGLCCHLRHSTRGTGRRGRATAGPTRAVPEVSAQTTPAQTVSWSIPIIHWSVVSPQQVLLPILITHWGRDKMDAISQTTCSSAFSWMKMFEFRLRFHWILFPGVQLTIFQHWFR